MNTKWMLVAWLCLTSLQVSAQADDPPRVGKIVLFLPFQLDSIFTAEQEYRLGRYEFPRFASGPLEFYQGMITALDSLKIRGGQIDLTVIDTRSNNLSLRNLLDSDSVRAANIWLMFGNATESRLLAQYADAYQIPLININLPNDAGIENNPHYFMWNSTLATQCEAMYRHLQQYYPLHDLLLVRKKGSMEDRILQYFDQYGKRTSGVALRYRVIDATDSIPISLLKNNLDTARESILIGASLDENFARSIAQTAAALRAAKYPVELMGMSTWDNVKEFAGNRYRNLEITIPSPFYYSKTDEWSKWLQTRFQNENYGKLSDLYLRGYEMAWLLHPLLLSNTSDLKSGLIGKRKLLFAEIDWQPVLDLRSGKTNYLENKKMYFVKRLEGVLRSVR